MRLAPSDGKAIPPTFLLIPLRAQRSAFADLPSMAIFLRAELGCPEGPEEVPPPKSAAVQCRTGERRADPVSALLRGSEAAVDGAGAQQGIGAGASVAGRVG